MKKKIALLMACVMAFGIAVGGTLAWLTAQDAPVVNTFSTSTIGVELKETEATYYKMIPGWEITKDPKAWITEGSEAAYLFVEVKESENFDTFMTYAIADGWTLLDTNTVGTAIDTIANDTYVIYREVASAELMGEAKAAAVLAGDKVTVLGSVTKDMMTADGFTQPTLTFTAYASQLYKNEKNEKFTAAEAWANIADANANGTPDADETT